MTVELLIVERREDRREFVFHLCFCNMIMDVSGGKYSTDKLVIEFNTCNKSSHVLHHRMKDYSISHLGHVLKMSR